MKFSILLIITLILFTACNNNPKPLKKDIEIDSLKTKTIKTDLDQVKQNPDSSIVFKVGNDNKMTIHFDKINNSKIAKYLGDLFIKCQKVFVDIEKINGLTEGELKTLFVFESSNNIVNIYFLVETNKFNPSPYIMIIPRKDDCPEFTYTPKDSTLITAILPVNNGEGKISIQTIFPSLVQYTDSVTPNLDGINDEFNITILEGSTDHANDLVWIRFSEYGNEEHFAEFTSLPWNCMYGNPPSQAVAGTYEFEAFFSHAGVHDDAYLFGTFQIE